MPEVLVYTENYTKHVFQVVLYSEKWHRYS